MCLSVFCQLGLLSWWWGHDFTFETCGERNKLLYFNLYIPNHIYIVFNNIILTLWALHSSDNLCWQTFHCLLIQNPSYMSVISKITMYNKRCMILHKKWHTADKEQSFFKLLVISWIHGASGGKKRKKRHGHSLKSP